MSNSSRLNSEVSVSYSAGLVFCCQGIYNGLIVFDLERIRGRYPLSDGFSLAVPSRDAHCRQLGFATLYQDALIAGLRLPLHPLARDVLIFHGIDPSQLAPNG